MADILLDAHGSWDPSSVPAYTIVPKGSTLKFFTENMRLFGDSEMRRGQMLTSEPNQVVEALMQVQNYTVQPAPETADLLVPNGMTRKTPSGEMLLCTSDKCAQNGWHNGDDCKGLFAESGYEGSTIYFAVCRHIALNPTGVIPEINTQQKDVGSEEGAVPDETLDQMLDKYLNHPEGYKDLNGDERDKLKASLIGSWGDTPEVHQLVNRLDTRYA
jgi:hypothetical protein